MRTEVFVRNAEERALTVAALLNSKGWGKVITEEENTPLEKILSDLRTAVKPSFHAEAAGDGDCITISFYGNEAPYSALGEYVMREGSSNVRMTSEEIAWCAARRGYSLSWEKESTGKGLEIIDGKTYSTFLSSVRKADLVPQRSNQRESVLRTLLLFDNNGLNNAGVVLLSSSPELYLSITDKPLGKRLYKGNIFALIDKAKKVLNASLEEAERADRYIINEMILNAFSHAWYGGGKTTIELVIEEDRIEIYNPGVFPEGLTPHDYITRAEEGRLRNPLIQHALHASGLVHDRAQGFRSLENISSGLKFRWQMCENGFRVILERETPEYQIKPLSSSRGTFTYQYA